MPNNVFSTALARNPYPFTAVPLECVTWLRAGIAKPLIVALCRSGAGVLMERGA
ncbi:MAG: hypothetical protein ACLU6O_04585 [Bilophila wadsworthia]